MAHDRRARLRADVFPRRGVATNKAGVVCGRDYALSPDAGRPGCRAREGNAHTRDLHGKASARAAGGRDDPCWTVGDAASAFRVAGTAGKFYPRCDRWREPERKSADAGSARSRLVTRPATPGAGHKLAPRLV